MVSNVFLSVRDKNMFLGEGDYLVLFDIQIKTIQPIVVRKTVEANCSSSQSAAQRIGVKIFCRRHSLTHLNI